MQQTKYKYWYMSLIINDNTCKLQNEAVECKGIQ